jgi:hypothetical protein
MRMGKSWGTQSVNPIKRDNRSIIKNNETLGTSSRKRMMQREGLGENNGPSKD